MPLFTQRRLDCFYCGKKSVQRYKPGLSKWKCKNCQADNYLDANGDITEPPAPSTPASSRPLRYAQTIPRAVSPVTAFPESNTFCQTCLNNQHLVTQNLANYLPDTTDLRYHEFERNLPKYKKELEQRYPQVCANCEPYVRARMRAAGDLAKADYLGRMMHKTRQIGLPKDVWTPIFLLSTIGGLLWWFSTIALIIWNTLGSLARHIEQEEGLLDDPDAINILQCIGQAAGFARVEATCAHAAYTLSGWGVVAGVVSFWWNPVMRRRNIDRTTGLGEFYKLQTILLGARCAVWLMFAEERAYNLEPGVIRLIHTTMLGLNLAVPAMAYRTPRIARNPKIAFHDKNDILDSPSQSSPHQREQPHQKLQATPHREPMSTNISFPFSRLGGRESHEPVRLSTPPEERDLYAEDAMDIDTPQSRHNFRPATRSQLLNQPQESSPFYGKLPPAPVSQEHRMRNPPNKPSFQKTSDQRQERFFQSMTKRPAELDEDLDSPRGLHLEPATFFTAQDHRETGLEGWFSSNVFSLGEAGFVPALPQETNASQSTPVAISRSSFAQILPVVLLSCAFGAWEMAPKISPFTIFSYFTAAALAAIVAATRLIGVLSAPLINGSDILLCIVELLGAAALGCQVRQAVLLDGDLRQTLGMFPILFFGFMIIQECLLLFTAYRNMRDQAQAGGRASRNVQNDKTALLREKRPLPLDDDTTLFKSQSTITQNMRTSPSVSRSDGFAIQAPASGGIAGLSLGLGDNSLSSSSQRTSRVLRGRAQKPWEVGGL